MTRILGPDRLNLQLCVAKLLLMLESFQLLVIDWGKKIMCLIDQHGQISFRGSITVYT